jgi:hypothetical protein
MFLVRGRETTIVDMIAEHPPLMWSDWGRLREALETGQPVTTVDDASAGSEFFPKLVRMIMSLSCYGKGWREQANPQTRSRHHPDRTSGARSAARAALASITYSTPRSSAG